MLRIYAHDIFEGDAVGNHCLAIGEIGKKIGFEVVLYANHFDSQSSYIRPAQNLLHELRGNDTLFVSYSIYDPFFSKLLRTPCRKICYFHGITPPEFFSNYSRATSSLCNRAYEQLPLLSKFDKIITNSKFTKSFLHPFTSNHSIEVVPPIYSGMNFYIASEKIVASCNSQNELIMVGRVVPHKRIEDAIKLLKKLNSMGRIFNLTVIGPLPDYDYFKFLLNFAKKMGVLESIKFRGVIQEIQLCQYYKNATALLVTSLHEGFCIPIHEALYCGIPVLVRAGSAGEELCTSSELLQFDFDDQRWASQLLSQISFGGLKEDSIRLDRAKRAVAILERGGERVWQRILIGDSITK